jgi:hypothetical protein
MRKLSSSRLTCAHAGHTNRVPPGRFEVDTADLAQLSRSLWTATGHVRDVHGQLGAVGHGVDDGAGTPAAGAAFRHMMTTWTGAIGRLADSLGDYERGTELAAELYQHTDASALPSAPPPPPPTSSKPVYVDPHEVA